MYEFICYRCGTSGHIKANCPDAQKSPPPPPADRGEAEATYTPPPPPLPRPASERAQYGDRHPAAEWVRDLMGWGGSEDRSRKRAAEQVKEARDITSLMELTRVLPCHNRGTIGACRIPGLVSHAYLKVRALRIVRALAHVAVGLAEPVAPVEDLKACTHTP